MPFSNIIARPKDSPYLWWSYYRSFRTTGLCDSDSLLGRLPKKIWRIWRALTPFFSPKSRQRMQANGNSIFIPRRSNPHITPQGHNRHGKTCKLVCIEIFLQFAKIKLQNICYI
jgi:hypothetical protein